MSPTTSPAVITANLQRSGLVRADRPAAFIEKIFEYRCGAAVSPIGASSTPRRWSPAASPARATDGCARSSASGTCSPASRSPASNISPRPDNWRRVAHIIADAIYERLTGEKGYFDTRIVFVDETGPKEQRVKRLAIMDQDGANVRYLTRGDDLVLTPRFSPSTQEITYMSYGQGDPRVLSAQHRNRPARDRRQFSRHDLRAALLAGRPARHHEPAAGRQLQHLRDGFALARRRRG